MNASHSPRIYLDHNATAPLRPEARDAVIAALDLLGNPSSVHQEGRRVRAIVDDARDKIAKLINAKPAELVFTSGATEANCWALSALANGTRKRIAISAVEHESVRVSASKLASENPEASSWTLETVPVDSAGIIKLADFGREPAILALQHANNETGVCQPLSEAVQFANELGSKIHCDAVQSAGRIKTDFRALGVATMSLSAHKMGGPKGVGALVIREGINLPPLVPGGGQERGRRGGTENVAAIAGFGAAAEAALRDREKANDVAAVRDHLETELVKRYPHLVIIGKEADRLPNTSCFAMPGQAAETLVIKLDLAGIAVSSGAACSSGKVGQSHVLQAMNLPPAIANSAIRVSIGTETTRDDIQTFLNAWKVIQQESDLAA